MEHWVGWAAECSTWNICDTVLSQMAILSEFAIAELLDSYLNVPSAILPQLSSYLDLLIRWNARTNLTAIRSPEEIVRRHFGESLFAGAHLGDPLPNTLLDLGSGAGFPGLPIALLHPGIAVTLAESQNKKSTFLREVVRTLDQKNVEVWAGRAESLPVGRQFHTVTLRAVDNMAVALAAAAPLAAHQLILLTGTTPEFPPEFHHEASLSIPGSTSAVLVRAARS